jgi:undecaprenol kinase/diacylglycerol kinase (ATP)
MQSFVYAFNGLRVLFLEEHNARIHAAFAFLAILIGFLLKISSYEWIAILLCIALVFSLELINSAIENVADFATKENNNLIKNAKDMAAAAVLIAAIISLIIGIIIFLPKLLALL